MTSAVIINIDYEQHDTEVCRRIWNEIESRMLRAGFVKNRRIFLTPMDRNTTRTQAKAIVAEVENMMAAMGIRIFDTIREFYVFDYEESNDLLTPSNDAIVVDFLDTGTFEAYINKKPE